MCNLSWTPHSSLRKDNSLHHSCVSPRMDCLEYIIKNNNHASRLLVGDVGSAYCV